MNLIINSKCNHTKKKNELKKFFNMYIYNSIGSRELGDKVEFLVRYVYIKRLYRIFIICIQ